MAHPAIEHLHRAGELQLKQRERMREHAQSLAAEREAAGYAQAPEPAPFDADHEAPDGSQGQDPQDGTAQVG